MALPRWTSERIVSELQKFLYFAIIGVIVSTIHVISSSITTACFGFGAGKVRSKSRAARFQSWLGGHITDKTEYSTPSGKWILMSTRFWPITVMVEMACSMALMITLVYLLQFVDRVAFDNYYHDQLAWPWDRLSKW
ncbi:uncharacterized protein K489DRAFT_411696 [Dissoconium aciculare CBS 342.82]|uniref:Uncharacterized protein n=1 Tax=Dissoconium aciculare CBS 342.82 TaxID=1314786 RepID=A0A6J3LZW0_9PEZI|nr:uncharacterized protein K489DRAFT_411696 [Dissoconium aciculare CBS 342.82]KAF1821325.1 hypothetical protein K489DRAFT_411696 [Dissoconium aciculare CBS 342.82]